MCPWARLAAGQRHPHGLGGALLFKVFQYDGSERHFAGEGGNERVLGDHCLQIAYPVLQPGPGGTGEHEEYAGKDRIPAEPAMICGSWPSAADGWASYWN